jgi:hypothetical protein
MRRRLAAWPYTGPLGHLYAGAADVAVALTRWACARAAEAVARRGRRGAPPGRTTRR